MIMRRDLLKLMGAGLSGAARPESGAAASQFPKGAIIRTVLKDLPPEAHTTGAVLFHEHMSLAADFMPRWIALARSAGMLPGNPSAGRGAVAQPAPAPQPYFMQDAELMAGEMSAAAKDGVACIVDQGHPDMGRDLDFLKRISRESGLPIVAGCGYYTQPFHPPEIAAWREDFPLLQRLALPVTIGAVRIHDTRIIRLLEVLLHGGNTVGGWTAKQIHETVLATFSLSASTYRLNQLRYDLRGHGLLERDGSRYAYQLTCSSTNASAVRRPTAGSTIGPIPRIDPTANWKPRITRPMLPFSTLSICLPPLEVIAPKC
jgi:hypothetical protein